MLQPNIYYEDLLLVPFLEGGRDASIGLDCQGFVIEMTKRAGKPFIESSHPNVNQINEFQAAAGDILQCLYKDRLHLAYLLDPFTAIHMTTEGVRVTPTFIFNKKKYFRVKEK